MAQECGAVTGASEGTADCEAGAVGAAVTIAGAIVTGGVAGAAEAAGVPLLGAPVAAALASLAAFAALEPFLPPRFASSASTTAGARCAKNCFTGASVLATSPSDLAMRLSVA